MDHTLPWAGPSSLGPVPAAAAAKVTLPLRRLIVAVGLLSAISAVGGAIALVVWRSGNEGLPLALVQHTPFTSFLVPGLLLGIVVGGSSLACAVSTWRRSRAAVDATILAGGALTVWSLAGVAMMREFHWLHGVYGGVGLAILVLGVRAAWRAGRARHRWVLAVTVAEAIGFLVPACTAIFTTRAGFDDLTRLGWVVAAGLVEGLLLGAGQAWAFPLPLRRRRYALLTALGAALVWSTVMLVTLMVRTTSVRFAVLAGAAVTTGLVGLAAIGMAQWIELRHHVERAHRWIAWTALAWAAALPLSFAPGPFVDQSTPLPAHLVLWGSGGLLMAYVMALITWQGVRHLCGPCRDR